MEEGNPSSTDAQKQILVIGAGFSGLVAARALVKRGFRVRIVEKSSRPGGLISSQRRSGPNGWLVETAANGLLNSVHVESLFQELKLNPAFTRKAANRRYIWIDGKLWRWPLNLFATFRFLIGLLRFKWSPPRAEETLSHWACRVFGVEFDDRILSAATLGIYSVPSKRLSAKLVAGRFYQKRTKAKSQKKGTIAPKDGMGALIEALQKDLKAKGVQFQFGIDGAAEALRSLRLGQQVVLATSLHGALAVLTQISNEPNLPQEVVANAVTLKSVVEKVETRDLINIGLLFDSAPSPKGFGALFSQNPLAGGAEDGILGVLQNSQIFEHRVANQKHSETWILGDDPYSRKFENQSDENLVNLVLHKRQKVFDNTHERPIESVVFRWPHAIPLCDVQLELAQKAIAESAGPLVLFGNYVGEIGLQSILEQSEKMADVVVERI